MAMSDFDSSSVRFKKEHSAFRAIRSFPSTL